MQELKDLYDIYDFWYIPWWSTWWGMTIVALGALIMLVVIFMIVRYLVQQHRRKRYDEWHQMRSALHLLCQNNRGTKEEYEQVVAIVKRMLALRFGTLLQSKTDEELCLWLQTFPVTRVEYQFIPLFDAGHLRFAPAMSKNPYVPTYAKMALEYSHEQQQGS